MFLALVVAALVVAALGAGLSAQGFELRLGQWEYTMNITMPPEMLAKLPPAARAQIQQPQTNRSCLTAQDLKEMNLGVSDDEDCKVTSKKITGSAADITMTCTGDRPRTQSMHVEAVSRESMRGTMKMTGGDGPSEVGITGKWIGAACKE
jgi:hypothetical protein